MSARLAPPDSASLPDVPLHFLTVAQASGRIARREITPVALVEAYLARIEAVNGRLNAFLTVTADRARAAAERAEREIAAGHDRGALHGIPFAVKDNYHVAGIRTTAASRLMLDHVATGTATAVARLEAAGAILLGKLNTWEFGTGSGIVQEDLPFPVARNPWDLDRVTGGSSSGAGAAVAAGLAAFALGSDTGGSVRMPAAACGLAGLKPTYGRVSRAECLPNCWSLDHNGPLAWTAQDAAIVLGAIAGFDEQDPSSADELIPDFAAGCRGGVAGLRIGVVRDLDPTGATIDPSQLDAFAEMLRVLADLGATLVDTRLPAPLGEFQHVSRIINWAESFSIHEVDFLERRHLMGQALREKMMCGFQVRAADYIAALRQRRALAGRIDDLVAGFDALVMPGVFHVAPRLDEPATIPRHTTDSACPVFNLTGHPAMVVCTGFADGLPLNAQIAGRAFDETTVLRVAHAFETATPWRARRPDL